MHKSRDPGRPCN